MSGKIHPERRSITYSARHDSVTWLGVARLSVAQPYVRSAQCRCKTVWACATLPA